jgi:hypothetical protein
MGKSAADLPAARPLHLGCFGVGDGCVVAADAALPVAAEIDAVSGAVRATYTWPVSPYHRGRPVAADLVVLADSIMIASPAAGGIVQISRATAETTVIPLDADVAFLTGTADGLWAIASRDWEIAEDDEPAAPDDRRHPVIWRGDPSGWDKDEDDGATWVFPVPVWHISDGSATPLAFEAESLNLAALGDGLVGLVRLPSDPLVKQASHGGRSVGYGYPGTAITVSAQGVVDVICPVPSTRGVVAVDGGRVWLLGLADELEDEDRLGGEERTAQELLPAEGRVAGPAPARFQRPATVLDGFIVDTGPGRAVRFAPVDGGAPHDCQSPPVQRHAQVVAAAGEVWIGNPGESVLLAAAPGRDVARRLDIGLDCRPWMTEPVPPPGFDPDQFDQDTLAALAGALLGGWGDETGSSQPLIEGVTIGPVELHGIFPDSKVVAMFRAANRPGIQFARRWVLYDELGNPVDPGYAAIYLMEDVKSGYGLPAPADCQPDSAGVVWF